MNIIFLVIICIVLILLAVLFYGKTTAPERNMAINTPTVQATPDKHLSRFSKRAMFRAQCRQRGLPRYTQFQLNLYTKLKHKSPVNAEDIF